MHLRTVHVAVALSILTSALLAGACSSSAPTGGGNGQTPGGANPFGNAANPDGGEPSAGDGGATSDASAPDPCATCGADQVCDNGTCRELPAACPCPIESYCDLASSTCKKGCTGDELCSSGRICDTSTRQCQPGCRADVACGAGKICEGLVCVAGCRSDGACRTGEICEQRKCQAGCRRDATCGSGQICEALECRAGCRADADCGASGMVCDTATLSCRAGCRTTTDCPQETICNATSRTCLAGCDGDARCNTGRICESGACRDGCRTSATCPLRSSCNTTTKTCQVGCAADPARCGEGEACVPYNNSTRYECSSQCWGWTCNGAGYTCFDFSSRQDSRAARCRKECTSDASCTTGQKCLWFTSNPQVPGQYSEHLCSKPCVTNGDCAGAVNGYGTSGSCVCGPAGQCLDAPGSQYICYFASPSAGL